MYVYCVTVLSLILSFDFCRPRSPFERSRAKKEEKKKVAWGFSCAAGLVPNFCRFISLMLLFIFFCFYSLHGAAYLLSVRDPLNLCLVNSLVDCCS